MLQQLPFSISIHRLPKSIVGIHHQLTIRCEMLKRFSLQRQIIAIIKISVSELTFEDEEAAVDESFGYLWLLAEALHRFTFNLQLSEAAGGTHTGDRAQLAV